MTGIYCHTKYTTVTNAVDSCSRAFVAAVKKSALFVEFCICSSDLLTPMQNRRLEKSMRNRVHHIRSHTIRMILKLIFQGKNINNTITARNRSGPPNWKATPASNPSEHLGIVEAPVKRVFILYYSEKALQSVLKGCCMFNSGDNVIHHISMHSEPLKK